MLPEVALRPAASHTLTTLPLHRPVLEASRDLHGARRHGGRLRVWGGAFETGDSTKSVLRWGISDRRKLGTLRPALTVPRALTATAGAIALIALFWFRPGGYLLCAGTRTPPGRNSGERHDRTRDPLEVVFPILRHSHSSGRVEPADFIGAGVPEIGWEAQSSSCGDFSRLACRSGFPHETVAS